MDGLQLGRVRRFLPRRRCAPSKERPKALAVSEHGGGLSSSAFAPADDQRAAAVSWPMPRLASLGAPSMRSWAAASVVAGHPLRWVVGRGRGIGIRRLGAAQFDPGQDSAEKQRTPDHHESPRRRGPQTLHQTRSRGERRPGGPVRGRAAERWVATTLQRGPCELNEHVVMGISFRHPQRRGSGACSSVGRRTKELGRLRRVDRR